ncbi:hypothetical protein EJ08DRAFT_564568, partial [Tothia fuscella]
IGDVLEREPSAPKPPSFKSKVTGFPAHKKRTGISKFKRNRSADGGAQDENTAVERQHQPNISTKELPVVDSADFERRQIDEDNRKRLADMSEAEIEEERKELFANLNPAFIQNLLRRSNIEDQPVSGSTQQQQPPATSAAETTRCPSQGPRKVSFALPDEVPEEKAAHPTAERHSISESSDSAIPNTIIQEETPHMHFPKPPTAPELDPNSSSFLDDLHEKYFPNLAHDPSKLAWMTDVNPEENSAYDPSQTGLDPAEVRFSFKGELIPPSKAKTLSTDLGLHHHGDAPSVAGYTIAELAMLARSSFPAQRCIAFQTLGRILYRLGVGEFGVESNIDAPGLEGEKAMLAKGLWTAVKYNRVMDTLTEEAKKEKGHRTAIAMAQEAVWNWRRGGGRTLEAV